MKLEEIVTSLELSKRLSELGVKQESLFYWVISITDKIFLVSEKNQNYISQSGICSYEFGPHHIPIKYFYSAFTASELIDFFPTMISTIKDHDKKFISVYEKVYGLPFINDHTEANCRAKILIHLIENKLIDPKEV